MTDASYPSPTAWARMSRRNMLKTSAAAGAVILGGSALVACGSDDDSSSSSSAGSTVEIGKASGSVSIGSNASDEAPQAGLAASVAAYEIANADVDVSINTLDHNTYQENITTILQAQDDDVLAWFAGFRNKFFADQGLVGDISDVWSSITGLGEGFKAASTASDGKQYFVPTAYYTWAVNFSKPVFEENGFSEPTDWDGLMSLAEDMAAKGITPIGAANDGKWPQMGTFDALNMRTNGYDFHIDLMGGKESWTDERVKNVFTNWEALLPFYQDGANGRTWQESAIDMMEGRVGMYLLGTFAASADDRLLDEMDFFNFPEIDSDIGAASLDAPIDGYQMVASPDNAEAAKEVLLWMSTPESQNAYLAEDPSVVASNGGANSSGYNSLQKKSAELANAATGISQFLDRDTIPDFAGACGDMFAQFIEDPSGVDAALADLQEKKDAIFADFES
ncbi:MAG: multiple sugar transport system substrate-binding protein [Acidimicrobiales bacterium]|jgi:multiple sugar transport system substrate-binding protein